MTHFPIKKIAISGNNKGVFIPLTKDVDIGDTRDFYTRLLDNMSQVDTRFYDIVGTKIIFKNPMKVVFRNEASGQADDEIDFTFTYLNDYKAKVVETKTGGLGATQEFALTQFVSEILDVSLVFQDITDDDPEYVFKVSGEAVTEWILGDSTAPSDLHIVFGTIFETTAAPPFDNLPSTLVFQLERTPDNLSELSRLANGGDPVITIHELLNFSTLSGAIPADDADQNTPMPQRTYEHNEWFHLPFHRVKVREDRISVALDDLPPNPNGDDDGFVTYYQHDIGGT